MHTYVLLKHPLSVPDEHIHPVHLTLRKARSKLRFDVEALRGGPLLDLIAVSANPRRTYDASESVTTSPNSTAIIRPIAQLNG